jgi:hypothetical protein
MAIKLIPASFNVLTCSSTAMLQQSLLLKSSMLRTLSSSKGDMTPINNAAVAVGPSGTLAAQNGHRLTLGSMICMSQLCRVSWIYLIMTAFCLPSGLMPAIAPASLSGLDP